MSITTTTSSSSGRRSGSVARSSRGADFSRPRLDLLVRRQDDEISNVHVRWSGQHEYYAVGHIFGSKTRCRCNSSIDCTGVGDCPEVVEDDARRDSSHPYPTSHQLTSKAVRKCLERMLGSRVHGFPADCLMTRDRARDNDVTRGSRHHITQGGMYCPHDTFDIRVYQRIKVFRCATGYVSTHIDARIGDDDVDLSESLRSLVEKTRYIPGNGDVSPDGKHLTFYRVSHRRQTVRRACSEHEPNAATSELISNGETDAAASSCNNRHLASERVLRGFSCHRDFYRSGSTISFSFEARLAGVRLSRPRFGKDLESRRLPGHRHRCGSA